MKTFFLLILILALAAPSFGATYYISKSTGVDTNTSTQAKSKGTPWQHLPGMASCSSNCASYTPVAGDSFILMGCDTWVNSDLPISFDQSGTSGNRIYIGVDKTWYNATACPSGWNRPIIDAGGTSIGGFGWMIIMGPSSNTAYWTVDDIEWKGYENQGRLFGCFNQCQNYTIENNYFHGLAVTADNCNIIQLGATSTLGGLITQNIFDGSDRTGPSSGGTSGVCGAIFTVLPAQFTNNVILDLPNGPVGYEDGGTSVILSGNLIYNMLDSYLAGTHANAIEILGGGTYYIHDNVLHDINQEGGESMMIGNPSETDYVWNNLLYNLNASDPTHAQTPSVPQQNATGMSMFFWNNTIVSPGGQNCINYSSKTASWTAFTIQNNHCINGGAVNDNFSSMVTTYTVLTNTLMSTSTANSQGYTSAQTFAYSPTSITNSTVGTGTNLTASCTGSNTGLCSDTAYACSAQTVSGVYQVVCPARTANTRPTSAAWDVGAYEFQAGQNTVAPATNLFSFVAAIPNSRRSQSKP